MEKDKSEWWWSAGKARMVARGGGPWAATRDAEAEAGAGWQVVASTAAWLRLAPSDFERDEEGNWQKPARSITIAIAHCLPPRAARHRMPPCWFNNRHK
ncbi:hypothetical protein [Oryza sativa Japonica Group]|uniref:Uncharacterized protein n=1 Tax=Oryza sativa subsp. japonica TaxID=39947 RepID=Q5ZAT2_ORYSJ|nr:hypothetical protein [Oryza sativa Japonica Group]